MTRAYVSAAAVIFVAALAAVFMIPQTATAQQERPCGDRTRHALAVSLARMTEAHRHLASPSSPHHRDS
jgi:hypothetical protein